MLIKKRKIKVGIIANEFMDENLGRLGGFGWAAKRAAEVFSQSQEFEPIFLTPLPYPDVNRSTGVSNGTRIIFRSGRKYLDMLRLLPERIDILLTIDYRTDYDVVFDCLPMTPIITWVRDPRSPDDIDKMMTLRFPGSNSTDIPGLHRNDSTALSAYVQPNRFFNRRVILASKMHYLIAKHTSTYNMPSSNFVLPNPDVINYEDFRHKPSPHPRVIYLGRLDPIKRPWLFIELARYFPDVEFLMLGRDHFEGNGGWQLENLPENVKMLGHVSGTEKYELCSSAWVLVNTSLHEESPVSVFEALASETPVLSYEDWGDIVKSFGISIGQHTGNGLEGITHLVDGLDQLLSNHNRRQALAKAGHHYVKNEHNNQRFLSNFKNIYDAAYSKLLTREPTVKLRNAIKTGSF
ncbi:MAG: glycosyltransferase family 4 protein [Balneolales bacterium]